MKLNEIANNNQYFDTTTTGRSTPDEILFTQSDYHREKKGKVGEIETMSIGEYVRRCVDGFRSRGYGLGAYESGIEEDLVEKYMGMMEDGVKFHMPILDYRDGAFSQEGRNRIEAARRLGAKQVPVAILKDVEK